MSYPSILEWVDGYSHKFENLKILGEEVDVYVSVLPHNMLLLGATT